MGHVPLLDELAMVAAVGVAVTVALSRLELPTIAGLLVAGGLLGPYGFGLARSVSSIESLAEIGVVLLLFSIGLELPLSRLRDIFRQVALGAALQVAVTTTAVAMLASALGEPLGRAIFYGCAFALSSTAIVLRALVERQEVDAPHGRFIVGTLVFQDLCVVPMVLIVPLLATASSVTELAVPVGYAFGKAILVVGALLAISRLVVPRVLDWVEASRSREAFLLAILGLCIGTAWLTSLAGLSIALGAFLGGLVVADTEYGHRALGEILPLRDAFLSIFFVSLGMLFDPRVVLAQPLLVLVLLAGFVLGKGMLVTLIAMLMRFPARVAWLAGVGLAQFSEFGFVLTRIAESNGVVDREHTTPLFAAGIASMFLTPVLVRVAPHVTAGERLLAPLERLIGMRGIDEVDEVESGNLGAKLENHVVVIGLGLAGQLAARTLRECGMPFVGLDLAAGNVRRGKELGLPVYYGDATSLEALHHAHVDRARLVVVLINDAQATLRIVDSLRRAAPHVPVISRTQYLGEADALFAAGARDVVAVEVEGGVEIIARMLRAVDVPRNVIDDRIRDVRQETQTSERKPTVPRPRLGDLRALDDLKIESALVHEGSRAAHHAPINLRLRSETGALIVGVRRGDVLLDDPDPTTPFEPGDVVYIVGTSASCQRALAYFAAGSERPLDDARTD